MAGSYEARVAQLEQQQAASGFTVVMMRRDDGGRLRVSAVGRTWIAEPDESQDHFADRVQKAVGRDWFVITEVDARL